jgi:hypothetical protein
MVYRKGKNMNILQKLVLKLLGVKEESEPPSMHILVANELRTLISNVLVKRGIVTSDTIFELTDDSKMRWYRIRDRNYGESGSHYGIAEIICQPRNNDPNWPAWLKLIPTDKLEDVWLDMSKLADQRRPLGGHGLHDENRLKAANEFADQLLFKLIEMEKQTRE